MIAYHYPPVGASSGVHRTLKFSQYLPEFGWEPIVLTVHPRAYSALSTDQLPDIPEQILVSQAFSLDIAKHLSLFGSYPDFLAMPDRWNTWWFGGMVEGMRLIRKYKPEVIWATYPIATAHLIGLTLSKLSGLPLIADYRDSMTEDEYPENKTRRMIYRWIEKKVIEQSERTIFTTPGTLEMYMDRYNNLSHSKFCIIENGFDEEKFAGITVDCRNKKNKTKLTFIHSGLLYPSERNPIKFFEAISELKKHRDISGEKIEIILRASGNESEYRKIIIEKSIDDIIKLEEPIPYTEALREMLSSDGLLIFQASNCNHQIPAKLYEYIRAKKPIFAMTDPAGDTANTLRKIGIGTIAKLDSKQDIRIKFEEFVSHVENKNVIVADNETISEYSRKTKGNELAQLLNEIIS